MILINVLLCACTCRIYVGTYILYTYYIVHEFMCVYTGPVSALQFDKSAFRTQYNIILLYTGEIRGSRKIIRLEVFDPFVIYEFYFFLQSYFCTMGRVAGVNLGIWCIYIRIYISYIIYSYILCRYLKPRHEEPVRFIYVCIHIVAQIIISIITSYPYILVYCVRIRVSVQGIYLRIRQRNCDESTIYYLQGVSDSFTDKKLGIIDIWQLRTLFDKEQSKK